MKILVIDDEISLKEIYTNFLAKIGATTDFYDHPQKGWHAIDKQEYDLIITDLKMPIISGDEFISIVRSSQLNAHTPIILCSGHINRMVITELVRESKIYFLAKPFDSTSLLELVKKALGVKHPVVSAGQAPQELNDKWLQAFSQKLLAIGEHPSAPIKMDRFELWNFETIGLSFSLREGSENLNVAMLMKLNTFLKIAGKIQGTQYKEIESETLNVWQDLINGLLEGMGRVTFSKLLSQEFLALPGQKVAMYKFNTSSGDVLIYLN